jgi:hypothetical protein
MAGSDFRVIDTGAIGKFRENICRLKDKKPFSGGK